MKFSAEKPSLCETAKRCMQFFLDLKKLMGYELDIVRQVNNEYYEEESNILISS